MNLSFNDRGSLLFVVLAVLGMTTMIIGGSSTSLVWADVIEGTEGDDFLVGTEGDDDIRASGGDDIIDSNGGDDQNDRDDDQKLHQRETETAAGAAIQHSLLSLIYDGRRAGNVDR